MSDDKYFTGDSPIEIPVWRSCSGGRRRAALKHCIMILRGFSSTAADMSAHAEYRQAGYCP